MTDSEKLDLLLSDMQDMKADMQELKRRTTSIELTNKLNLSMLY